MDRFVRRALTVPCEDALLAATLHPASGPIGVLIVTGGVQTRDGSHRGFVELADRLAAAGHPVLRYDRRGVGDSDGADPGFRDSGPDIAAAVAGFRKACPDLTSIVGWGLCDGAAGLTLHAPSIPEISALMLANPWTLDGASAPDVPGRAAVAAHYRSRLRDPSFWRRLLRGSLDLRRVATGLARLLQAEAESATAAAVAKGLGRFARPVLILISGTDNTARTFLAAWNSRIFDAARASPTTRLAIFESADHSFARRRDAEAMARTCIEWLGLVAAGGFEPPTSGL